jgi:hypothetical protein
MNPNWTLKLTIAATLFAAVVCASSGKLLRASQPYLVSTSAGGAIWRIQDTNNDGDAFDLGERTLWGDGFVGARGMSVDGPAVYITEEGLVDGINQVVRLIDSNNDGDALDIGERIVWLDGLDDPRDVSRNAGDAYLSEFDNNQIWQMIDLNNDGDVVDVGERLLFADGINGPQMILPQAGTLLVTAEVGDQIHRLVDLNSDGDALDLAENLAITPNYDQLIGLIDDNVDGIYFSSFSTDTVYHARDNNGDGDMLDIAEVRGYADSVFGLLDGPSGLVTFDGGGFLVADTNNGQVKLVRDLNGDVDALDVGDVVAFSDGINAPADIILLPFALTGDFNRNGTVDAADYVVWRKGVGTILTQSDINVWRANFGQEFASGASAMGSASATAASQSPSVPEPATIILLSIAAAALCSRDARTAQKTSSTY